MSNYYKSMVQVPYFLETYKKNGTGTILQAGPFARPCLKRAAMLHSRAFPTNVLAQASGVHAATGPLGSATFPQSRPSLRSCVMVKKTDFDFEKSYSVAYGYLKKPCAVTSLEVEGSGHGAEIFVKISNFAVFKIFRLLLTATKNFQFGLYVFGSFWFFTHCNIYGKVFCS